MDLDLSINMNTNKKDSFQKILKFTIFMGLSVFLLIQAVCVARAEGNGVPETVHAEENGQPETLDAEENGQPETVHTEGNGVPETVHTEGNGVPETVHAEENGVPETLDAEGNGMPKTIHTEENGQPESVYEDQGILYGLNDDGTCYVKGYTEALESSVAIPVQIKKEGSLYTVKGIDAAAFQECTFLQKIEIPNSVTDIKEGTFAGCKKLTDICITPAEASVKKNGKAMVVKAKVNGALLSGAKNVRLEVGGDVLAKAASSAGTDGITLWISVVGQDGTRGKNTHTMPDSMELHKEAVQAVADSGKDFKVKVTDAGGRDYYVKVDASNMKRIAGGGLSLALQEKEVGNTSGTFGSDIKKALKKNGISGGRVQILSFSFGQGEKTDADVIFPAASGFKAGDKVYLYRYDKNKREFAAIFYQPHTVSRQGRIRVSISKGGTFVVAKKPFQYMAGKLAKGFLRESGNTYYIGKDGKALCGWRKIGDEYYYFDRETGKMPSGGKVDGIKVKSGIAEKTEFNIRKIQTMMKARTVVEQVTNSSDSKSQKIEKCFRWIFQFPYRRYRLLGPIYRQAGWEVTFANDIFDNHQGCCVSEASALAFLFHECGYKTVYVASDTGHAWVELNGRVYDPLFAEARGFSQYYNVSYSSARLWPVVKRKI